MSTCRRHPRDFSDNGFVFQSADEDDDCSRLEFEFGSIVLDFPFGKSSRIPPADRLFLDGKSLPVFPCQKTRTGVMVSGISRTPSRASSVSSRDFSGMSSRSNSTNSRSSSNCGGRTSSTDGSERSVSASLIRHHKKAMPNTMFDCYVAREKSRGSSCNAMEASYLYGSQRWQFITPVPSLSREASLRRMKQTERAPQQDVKKARERTKEKGTFRRFLNYFLMSCMQCHAMEPSRKVNYGN
ncbi:hypothetical protein MLD38_021990 [Melastoma candidum]|uniref:Uncharacterized protein n=1 Tax=Melastoma candidum TaxID=119954 RepID=A0ACB9QIA5_9MYRT|nr:hypothetical protein MLD38_021990 [Melastoma candidum]